MRKRYPDVSFQFYSGDATDIIERLDHGNLDFAILLAPIDITKYEYISLPDTSIWGVLMKKDCKFANLDVITKETLLQMPLILHKRLGLQQTIADWAKTPLDQLHITATYNVIHGTPISFVKNDMGYFLTTRDLLAPESDSSIVFKPLEPALKIQYNLVWKRKNILNNAARVFLDDVKKMVCYSVDTL